MTWGDVSRQFGQSGRYACDLCLLGLLSLYMIVEAMWKDSVDEDAAILTPQYITISTTFLSQTR